jgi:ubiquitin-protein ligase
MKQQQKRWVVDVAGAPDTLYTGETYKLQVDFSEHYPMEAPQVNIFSPDWLLRLRVLRVLVPFFVMLSSFVAGYISASSTDASTHLQ